MESILEVQYVPMSYDDWLTLSDERRSEWVDGVAILMPPQTPDHAESQFAIEALLRRSLNDVDVLHEVGIRLPRNRVRVPDVSVFRERPDGAVVDEIPLIAIEIVSRDSTHRDTVEKSVEYAAAGIGQYWLIDPLAGTASVNANANGLWEPVLRLDEAHPVGTVTVHGIEIELDLTILLGG